MPPGKMTSRASLIAAAARRAAPGRSSGSCGAVQDQGWHAELGQPAAVPFRAALTALCSGVADATDLVPLGHPAHFLLVEGIGR